MNSRRTTLIIAVVVAIACGLLTVRYLTAVDHSATATVVTRDVVVANRDIHAHEKIVPEMLTGVRRPTDQVEPGAISDPKQVLGDVSLIAIPEGSTLTETKVGVPAAIGITGKLPQGLRAMSIPMDYIKSVSGLVAPGDRVDVMATNTKGMGNGQNLPTRTIIRGALVLAVNNALEPTDQSSPSAAGGAAAAPAAVTLGVTPDQANLLTYADFNTTLRLALRSPQEPVRSLPVQSMPVPDVVGLPSQPQGAPPRPLPLPAVAAPAVKPTGIIVIEGDQIVGSSR